MIRWTNWSLVQREARRTHPTPNQNVDTSSTPWIPEGESDAGCFRSTYACSRAASCQGHIDGSCRRTVRVVRGSFRTARFVKGGRRVRPRCDADEDDCADCADCADCGGSGAAIAVGGRDVVDRRSGCVHGRYTAATGDLGSSGPGLGAADDNRRRSGCRGPERTVAMPRRSTRRRHDHCHV